MNTLVYIDHFKGEPLPSSWEALGLAKTLGTVTALIDWSRSRYPHQIRLRVRRG